MSRLTFAALLTVALSSNAFAESQAEIAHRENEEGKQLMFENKYAEASAKFASAHARSAEPKYFFNHCTSLFYEGKFGEALTACNAADKNADEGLKKKIPGLVEKIKAEAKKQGIDVQPTGGGGGPGDMPPPNGGDPNQPPPPNGDPNQPPYNGPVDQGAGPSMAVGRPPSVGLFSQARPENKYTWSLGLDLFGGGGRIGRDGAFGTGSGGARFKADYLLNPKQRLGTQGYFQLSSFGEGDDLMTGAQTLSVFDIGIAGFKHFCGPRSRLCLTPLAGVQLAMLSPGNQTDGAGDTVFNYASLGFRFELGVQYMLGSRYEHVIGVGAGMNLYTRAFSEPMDGYTAAEWGLDRGGRAGYFGVGYTYRFNTPFGSAPFVTLE